MKAMGIKIGIENDMHELYEIEPEDNWSQFPWRIPYADTGEDFRIDPDDHPENWYFVPIAYKGKYGQYR